MLKEGKDSKELSHDANGEISSPNVISQEEKVIRQVTVKPEEGKNEGVSFIQMIFDSAVTRTQEDISAAMDEVQPMSKAQKLQIELGRK
jgi:hypothetical protein